MVGAAGDAGVEPGLGDPRELRGDGWLPRRGAIKAARVVAAAADGRAGWPGRAAVGVVLGTGLGSLADRLDEVWSIPARDTGWLPTSTATGHAGRVVVGRASDRWVVALQGRAHGYEGYGPDHLVRGVELLAALGVTTLLVTNAAGGLRPDMQVGEVVVVTDHIDFVRRRREPVGGSPPSLGRSPNGAEAPRGGPATGWYDPGLVTRALDAARAAGSSVRAGVYAYLLGPSYETRAEYRMLRRFGADVVGMSTVPEVTAARGLGLRVAAVSVVTNVACPDAAGQTDAEDVCQAAAGAADVVWAILRSIAAEPRGEPAEARGGNE